MIAIICIELEYLFQNTKMYFWFYLWPLYHYIIYIKQIISSCTLPGTWMAKSFYILCKDWAAKKFPNLKLYIMAVFWPIFEFNTIFESYNIQFFRENKYKNVSCKKTREITVFHSFSKSQTCNMAFKDFTVEYHGLWLWIKPESMDFKTFITDFNCKIQLFLVPKWH